VSDRIRIEGLEVHAIVGVHEWERNAPRDVRLDVTLETDLSRAGATDDLAETVDYDILAHQIVDRLSAMQPRLIETIAAAAADVCLAHRRVSAVEVTVHKPHAIESARCVAVTIRRRRPGE
jgi:dihydroneopterin aldolase